MAVKDGGLAFDSVFLSSNGVTAIPARVISTSFALACFALTVCYGLYNHNTWKSILAGALLAGLIAWVVGAVLGALMLRSVNENIARYQADNPVPEDTEDVANDGGQADPAQAVSA